MCKSVFTHIKIKYFIFCLIIYFSNSCKNNQLCNPDDRIKCYFSNGDTFEYCPNELAPCDCEDASGNNIANTAFDNPCEGCFITDCPELNGGTTGTSNTDYEFECPPGKAGSAVDLCAEHTLYYFDSSPNSLDYQNGRPMVIGTYITQPDLVNNYYTIKLFDEKSKIIDEQSFGDYIDNTNVIDMSKPTGGYKVRVKMNLIFPETEFNQTLTYTYELFEVNISTKNETSLISNKVVIDNIDIALDGTWYNKREFNFTLYNTSTYNLDGIPMAGVSSFSDISNLVFNSANVKVIVDDRVLISENLVKDDDMVFDEAIVWDGTKINFDRGFDEWAQRVYKEANNSSGLYNNFSIGLPVHSAQAYRIASSTITVTTNEDIKTGLKDFFDNSLTLGITNSVTTAFLPPSVVSVVLRSAIDKYFGSPAAVTGFTKDQLSVEVMLHEMGHLWSANAIDYDETDGCKQHTNKGGGENTDVCLFNTICITPNDLDAMLLKHIDDPKFCFKHLGIFMNQLRTHNEPDIK